MQINSVIIENFRIIEHFHFNFEGKNAIIKGRNGTGKTSVIESIFYAVKGYSFRTRNIYEMVNSQKDYMKTEVNFLFGGMGKNALSIIHGKKHKETINGIVADTKTRLRFPLIVLTGKERLIIEGPPSLRRKFLDELLVIVDNEFADNIGRYMKSLKQRNASLKNGFSGIDIWEEMMKKYGDSLIAKRLNIIDKLGEKIPEYYKRISDFPADIAITYKPSCKDDLRTCLKESRLRDEKIGYTTVGPHRDDFIINLNGLNARNYASMGEKMALALSLKLAMADIVYSDSGESPLFLLDDVLAEIDIERGKNFINIVSSLGQFIITSARELFFKTDNIIVMGEYNG